MKTDRLFKILDVVKTNMSEVEQEIIERQETDNCDDLFSEMIALTLAYDYLEKLAYMQDDEPSL